MQNVVSLTESLDRMLRDLFGDVKSNVEEAQNIRKAIERKFREIKNLSDKLERIPLPAKDSCTAESLAASFARRYPYLYIEDAGDALPAILRCFDVGVRHAPFFLSTESGTPLYATAPVNEMAIRMNRGGLIGMVFRDMTDSDFVPDDPHPMMISSESYGHPHANESVDETGSMVLLEYRNLCFGSYGADAMFDAIEGASQVGTLIDRLYSWMIDVNVDSMFSERLSPVRFSSGYVDSVLVPACKAMREKTLNFMRSGEYAEFVQCMRQGMHNGPQIYAKAMSTFLGDPATEGTPVEWCVERCRLKFVDIRETPGMRHHYLNLAAHNIACAVMVLANKDVLERQRGGRAVVNGALGDLTLIPEAYAAQCRLDCLGFDGDVPFVTTLRRYVENYETILDWKYGT